MRVKKHESVDSRSPLAEGFPMIVVCLNVLNLGMRQLARFMGL